MTGVSFLWLYESIKGPDTAKEKYKDEKLETRRDNPQSAVLNLIQTPKEPAKSCRCPDVALLDSTEATAWAVALGAAFLRHCGAPQAQEGLKSNVRPLNGRRSGQANL